MASSTKEVNLLFFDTFYHDQNVEELNLDLIQFSCPVVVDELRVIPLRTQVEPNLGKGYRLGGTLPAEFKLDVFVNNLNRPNASTFERLGQLDYKENKNIQLKLDREVPTDGLILKGWYRAVTLAVYGWVTTVNPVQDSPPPPPPPHPPLQTPQSKIKIDPDDDPISHKASSQHPIDFINEQVKKQQQQELFPQQSGSTLSSSSSSAPLPLSTRDASKPKPLEEAFVDVIMKPSAPRSRDWERERDRGSSHDRDRAPSHDSHDLGKEGDILLQERSRGELTSFPPEPKEPYESSRKEKERWEEEKWGTRGSDRDIGRRGLGIREDEHLRARDSDRPRSIEKQDIERSHSDERREGSRSYSAERRDTERQRSAERRDIDSPRYSERHWSLERSEKGRSRSVERRDRERSWSLERRGREGRSRSRERRDRERSWSLERRDKERRRSRSVELRERDDDRARSLERRDRAIDRPRSVERRERDIDRPRSVERRDRDIDRPGSVERRGRDIDRSRSIERRDRDIDRPRSVERRERDVDRPRSVERKDRDIDRPHSVEKRDRDKDRPRSVERRDRDIDRARSSERRERDGDRSSSVEMRERGRNRSRSGERRERDAATSSSIERRERDIARPSSVERQEKDADRPRSRERRDRDAEIPLSLERRERETETGRDTEYPRFREGPEGELLRSRDDREVDRHRLREPERDYDSLRKDKIPKRRSSRETDTGSNIREISRSREGSREPKSEDVDRFGVLGEHQFCQERDPDRGVRQRDSYPERERDAEKEKNVDEIKKERIREKELMLEREKELERETREKEQFESKKREQLEKDRERVQETAKRSTDNDAKEKIKERESGKEAEREKDLHERELKFDPDRPSRRARVSPKPTSRRSRSRSGSRSRKRSRSRSGSRSLKRSRSGSGSRSRQRGSPRIRKRARSSSMEKDQQPAEPQMGDHEDEEEAMDDEEVGERAVYRAVTSRSVRRRGYNPDSQDGGEGYEDISSDEDDGPSESQMQVLDMYELEEEAWGMNAANPPDFYLTPMLTFKSPCLSTYEIELLKYRDGGDGETPAEARALMDIMYRFSESEHQDRWVLAMEEIPNLLEKGLSYLLGQEKKTDVLDVLIKWVMEGCDPDIAMTQPGAAFKIRHLKIGMKLAGLLCAQEESIALKLLHKGIQSKLLNLYESPYIVFSMKHLALRALAKTTHFSVGVKWLLGIHSEVSVEEKEESGYQRLVKSLLTPKIVKLTMSVTALLRKVHFYETLSSVLNLTEMLAETSASMCDEQHQSLNKNGEDAAQESEEPPQLNEEEENKLLANLEAAITVLANPHELTGQEHNAVPYNLLMDKKIKSPYTMQSLFNICDSCGLLESVLVLVANPTTVSCPAIYLALHNLLQLFTSNLEGLLYLASHPETTNGILRCLFQLVEEPDDSGEEIPSRHLGMELVYHLQVVQFIDQMFHWQAMEANSKTVDSNEVLSILHGLYTMTFSASSRDPLLGRNIVAKVLSFDHNLDIFFPYLEKTGDEEFDEEMLKSVSTNYSTQLLLMVVKTSADVSLIEKNSQRLLQVCQDSTNSKLQQLQEWVSPARKVTSFDLDGLPSIISQLKTYADEIKQTPLPALITTVRILYSLIGNAAWTVTVDNPGNLNEAKNRYLLVELYSAECLPIFLSTLQKMTESQLKIWQQGIPYTTDQWMSYFALIKPTLSLVHATLCQLIQAFRDEKDMAVESKEEPTEGEEKAEPLTINPFKDLTAIPILLELHTVMCSVPTSSLYNNDLNKIQRDICDTLLAFTQEELQQTQTDDALSRSLWTLMLKELLKYTIKSPYTYMSGLLILSELLPLPFPLHTKDALSEEEIEAAIMSRKLWSVHLQSATPELFSVLDTLSGTGCQPLQHLMRRVCWQIADLAAPSALRITKILLDILMVNLKPKKPSQASEGTGAAPAAEKKEGSGAGEEEMTAVRTVSIHTAKTLNLFTYLLSHPGIKAALLQLIGTSINSDPKYKDFLPIMLQLLNQTAETPAEIQAQEGIVSMIHNMCELEISMVNTDLPVTLAEHAHPAQLKPCP
ncbi:virilizer-like protein [Elysia marginata]|uniref:Virilizer-like protein n=1 Tax=Elysia marginata TaxID=1093978 RepID=A0AAV4H813_9GAST|nr:virilizer-like protein [Elysia marginata]